jgi:hypothetical protein
MGYTTASDMVRVDFFKPSGKWYTTEAVKWTGGYSDVQLTIAFAKSLKAHLSERPTQPGLQHENHRNIRLSGMVAVCLHPYHEHEVPLMMAVDDVEKHAY